MSAIPPALTGVAAAHDQYIVSHGKSGAVGVFTAPEPLALKRGHIVLIETSRGIESGAILCAASLRQARLLGATASGTLVRPFTPDDESVKQRHDQLEQAIFETSRAWVERDALSLEILDVEVLFDGRNAIVQFVGQEASTEKLAVALERQFGLSIRFENLAAPRQEEHEHGCDKPDCGRTAGGGCSTCSTGGGCSSCDSGKNVDMRDYFAHLRTKMESRIPLA
jgi:hypothetical protein